MHLLHFFIVLLDMGIASCHIQIHPRCSSILLRGWFLCNVLFWRNSSTAGGYDSRRAVRGGRERDVPPAFAGAARRACPRALRKMHRKSRLCQRAQTKTAPPQAVWPGGAAERQGRKSGGAPAPCAALRGKPLSVRRRRTPGPRPGRFARWQRRPRPCFAHCFAAHTRRRCRRRW